MSLFRPAFAVFGAVLLILSVLMLLPVRSEISLSVIRREKKVIIDISDQGPGIPGQERQLVLNKFYTVKSGDRHVAGTGLGLAICKGMIGAHGGTIDILDNPDYIGVTLNLFRVIC